MALHLRHLAVQMAGRYSLESVKFQNYDPLYSLKKTLTFIFISQY